MKRDEEMKKSAVVITVVVMFIACIPMDSFANVNAEKQESDMTVEDQIDCIVNDMEEARDNNGVISSREQQEIKSDYSVEAIIKYNEIAYEEALEVIDEEVEDIIVFPETEVDLDDTYDLDCGAQLRLVTLIEDVEDNSRKNKILSIFGGIKEYFCPSVYADTQPYGTKKFTQKAYVIGAGTVTLTMTAYVKSSNRGLKITSGSVRSNSIGWSHDVKTKKSIEKASVSARGSVCKIRGGVQWYDDIYIGNVYIGKTSKKWRNMRFTYKLFSINRASVSYKFSVSRWTTKSW